MKLLVPVSAVWYVNDLTCRVRLPAYFYTRHRKSFAPLFVVVFLALSFAGWVRMRIEEI